MSDFWHSLTADELSQASLEYLEKYGHLLPSELTQRGGARVRGSFFKYLEKHPYLIQKIRGVGR